MTSFCKRFETEWETDGNLIKNYYCRLNNETFVITPSSIRLWLLSQFRINLTKAKRFRSANGKILRFWGNHRMEMEVPYSETIFTLKATIFLRLRCLRINLLIRKKKLKKTFVHVWVRKNNDVGCKFSVKLFNSKSHVGIVYQAFPPERYRKTPFTQSVFQLHQSSAHFRVNRVWKWGIFQA